jgi:hypothetical protein
MAEEVFDGIQRCIDDAALYIPPNEFFNLLQDEGVDVTDKQRAEIDEKLKQKKTKNIARSVLYNYKLHREIYKLALQLYKKWHEAKDDHFTDLPKNETNAVHMIGKYILEKRQLVPKAQYSTYCLANDGVDNPNVASAQDQIVFARELDSAYLLTQASVLKHFKCKWGQSLADIMKPTINDKARVSLLLYSDDLREYVPDMLSRTKSAPAGSSNDNNRPNLDAANGRKKRGMLLLFNAFKDTDVVAKLPVGWSEAREHIDSKMGEGVYAEYGQFDPNDASRIALPWTEKSVKVIFKCFLTDFNAAAVKWTQGTGGGAGAPEDFVVWQTRDPLDFRTYPKQQSNLYLTPVYMYDKSFGFILVEPKDPLPPGCRIKDGVSVQVPSTSKKSVSEENVLTQFTEQMKSLSEARGLQSKELQNVLNGNVGGDAEDIIIQIERTTQLVDKYETKTSKLKDDQVQICNGEGSRSEKKRKLKPILLEVKANNNMVKQLKFTLEKQCSELAKVNGREEVDQDNGDDLFDGISVYSS